MWPQSCFEVWVRIYDPEAHENMQVWRSPRWCQRFLELQVQVQRPNNILQRQGIQSPWEPEATQEWIWQGWRKWRLCEGTIVNEAQLTFEGMQLMNALYTFEMVYTFSRFTNIKNAPQMWFWHRPRVRLQLLSRQATFDSFQWRFRGRPQWKGIIQNFEYPYHFSVQKLEKSHFFDGTISKHRHYIDTQGDHPEHASFLVTGHNQSSHWVIGLNKG